MKLLNVEQAAEFLGVAKKTLAIWRSTGRYNLPFVKVGRRVMYRQDDLDQFVDRRTACHTGEVLAMNRQ